MAPMYESKPPLKMNQRRFTNIVARWPGSTHDSHIFRMSGIRQTIEEKFHSIKDGVVLGDSGYACKPYLISPYQRPSTPAPERFNSAHSKTRVTIERAFDWWKRRFHVLHAEIVMTPERVWTVIGGCAVLHNLAISFREPLADEDQDLDVDGNIQGQYNGPEDGKNIRNYIKQHYF
ncbi:putative nuclease HARBI1 [Saccostrea echinata]|uniref:putative nuclease HARBI1 n=1 Tax=Saccostrea echinata TaxID=191078 RepID=UPI002A841BFB|nr:putative nuclease HARBI1 [Saccostrea echinata]XP_061169510.1 putative nuclease HARBI1 [Saccostrea echinata]